MRNKTGAILIALQIAVTMAIMVNAISIMQERSRMMARPSGVDEANIFYISSVGFAEDFNERVAIEEDLNMLRSLPGVVDAIQTNSVPLSDGGWSMGLQTEPGAEIQGTGVAIYFVDEHGMETFGLELLAGEDFSPGDVGWRERSDTEWPDKGIITRAMAEALYPDDPDSALGSTVYINDDEPLTITGIMKQMQAPWNGWSGVERVMLVPQHTLFGATRYVVRAEPGRRDELMPQVEQILADSNKGRIVRNMRTMEETRERSYRSDGSMIKMLTFVIALLTLVTALGIVGLASFSVSRRTKQIGTRRALGASRSAILRYFMTENLLISIVGVLAGGALAVGLNMWMVDAFDLTRLGWYLVPVAMVLLLLVGQIAVLGPARRAASVPPAVATRTV
ncbi:MAG: FtsX-like permease family protein [Xanthomonadales bacterium]|nr:ABC transporter permease [Gammaproteobacteria bacterium]NNE04713.1 FtsX-like permease family protein [Xanthomonadales bacterium]NNL94030.1 FtsX-like permease family protein [Xanthomonadales bacterium]